MPARKPVKPKTIPPELELLVTREEAKAKLQQRIEKGKSLIQLRVDSPSALEELQNEYSKWSAFNTELLRQIANTSKLADEYSFFAGVIFGGRQTLSEQIAETFQDISKKIHRLDSIIERLEIIPIAESVQERTTSSLAEEPASPRSRRVFVVHGHDEIAKTSLEVFLHEVGLEPVVLHRQADEGMTIIEKIEKHSDVGYAFILLTPDEVTYLAKDEIFPDEKRNKEKRARPNVIFEFGYFIAKLGRDRVCCLLTGGTTPPGDVSGMVYKSYQSSIDEVAYAITKDLKASGYELK